MRRIVYSALFIAFGNVLPMVFHAVGMGGPVFLPMHFPVLLAGLMLGPAAGVVVGVITPVVSFVLTGMPPVSPPILPTMIVELAAYGAVAGLLAARSRRNLWVPLVGAMVVGRIALGLAVVAAVWLFGFKADPITYVTGSVVTGLPGIVLQLLVVPVLYRIIEKLPAGLAFRPAYGER